MVIYLSVHLLSRQLECGLQEGRALGFLFAVGGGVRARARAQLECYITLHRTDTGKGLFLDGFQFL